MTTVDRVTETVVTVVTSESLINVLGEWNDFPASVFWAGLEVDGWAPLDDAGPKLRKMELGDGERRPSPESWRDSAAGLEELGLISTEACRGETALYGGNPCACD